ncbi:MAG: hypothetical protein B6243_11470 [Anaerolineaceae bacterium 4572_5.2]|nr:MAG: hypothetical protein B6243_11470 [Anaerolineaceae bacterium 4572_5.2]
MLPIIYELLLSERKIAYLLTDRDLKILNVSASADFLPKDSQFYLGRKFPEVCPEMAGNEEALSLLLSGNLERFELVRINREVELQRFSEVKSSFVSVAAHELRSPLSSILGYTEILLERNFGELNPKQAEFLQIVQRSTNRLLDVSTNLLDANRIETGRIDLLLKPLDLAALIRGYAAEFEVQLRRNEQKLTLHTEPDLPMALCDETKTIQIINNLLSNASKYTLPEGKITVNLRQADEAGFLLLSVTDTGIGIAPKERKKLFDRFYRASNVYQTRAGGSGLGLYITRSLVELHGGRIWVKSELGVGSTFFVTFPQN